MLARVTARPLSVLSERSLQSGEVPEDWKKATVTPVSEKGKQEKPGTTGLSASLCVWEGDRVVETIPDK